MILQIFMVIRSVEGQIVNSSKKIMKYIYSSLHTTTAHLLFHFCYNWILHCDWNWFHGSYPVRTERSEGTLEYSLVQVRSCQRGFSSDYFIGTWTWTMKSLEWFLWIRQVSTIVSDFIEKYGLYIYLLYKQLPC